MITPEFLKSCTDEQINKGVAWLECKKFEVGRFRYSSSDNAFIEDGEECIIINCLCYCESPSDSYPIISENNISTGPVTWSKEETTKYAKYYPIFSYDKNQLRAAMEVYILMSTQS